MLKSQVIQLLGGGSISKTASAMGVTVSRISQLKDPLPRVVQDRVIAAFVREGRLVPHELTANLHALPQRANSPRRKPRGKATRSTSDTAAA